MRRHTWGANWCGSTSSVEKEGCAMLNSVHCLVLDLRINFKSLFATLGQQCYKLENKLYAMVFFSTERGTVGSCLSFLDIRI